MHRTAPQHCLEARFPSLLTARTIRHRAARVGVALLLAALVSPGVGQAQTVNVNITTDNAYGFGYGSVTSMSTFYGGVENCTAAEIFSCSGGPETYSGVPAPAGSYLYIVAYSDGNVTQGSLGQFVDAITPTNVVLTGTNQWQVYATGVDYDPVCPSGPANPPTLATINAQIATANSNSGGAGSSVGWVGVSGGSSGTVGVLAIGEDNNSASGDFPIVCGIDPTARWMWYNPDPSTITNPFRTGSPPNLPSDAGEFLIFRLLSDAVVPVQPTTWGRIKTLYR